MNGNASTTVALILAGGRGSRLSPLTDARPKPAVPLAGNYRLIDVALSNLTHSGLRDVWIVEQYRPGLLNRHLAGGRPWDLDGTRSGLRILPPGEGDTEDGFAEGNGHALFQQLEAVEEFGADTLVVLSADHLYQLDLRPVLAQHAELGSDLTVVTTEIAENPSRYGVVTTRGGRVTTYDYKPDDPDGHVVATEVFVFDVAALRRPATPCCPRVPTAPSSGTTARRSCRTWSGRAPSTSTAWRATGATSVRSTPTSARTWSSSRAAASTSTAATGRC
jgi:glucose-1-phosphate adenylyltransferase